MKLVKTDLGQNNFMNTMFQFDKSILSKRIKCIIIVAVLLPKRFRRAYVFGE